MRKVTRFSLIIVVIVLLFVIVFKFNSGKTIKVGIINPLSGPVMQRGEEITDIIKLAETDRVEMIFGDDKCDGNIASTTYNELKKKGVRVFYVSCSASLLAIAPQAKIDGNLIVTSYAGAIEIRNTGDEVIRFIPDALSAVDVIYSDITKLASSSKPAFLYEDQDYSNFIVSGVKERIGTSTKIISEIIPAKSTTTDKQIQRLKSAKVDTVFFIPASDHACGSPISVKELGINAICYEVGFQTDTEAYKKLIAEYKAKYKKDADNPFYDAITYDIFKLLGKFASTKHADDFIPELKNYIISGVNGEMSKYTFTKDGKVESGNLLKKISSN